MHLSIWRKPPQRPGAPRLPQKGDESGQISSASHGPRTATPQGTQARGSSGPVNPRCGVSRPETCPPPRHDPEPPPAPPHPTPPRNPQTHSRLRDRAVWVSGRTFWKASPGVQRDALELGEPLRPRGTQAHSGLALPHQGPAADTRLRLPRAPSVVTCWSHAGPHSDPGLSRVVSSIH